EIMAHVGFEPYEAIMVGNDWWNDIVPAAKTGMCTYWISDRSTFPDGEIVPDGSGTLADFAGQLLQQNWLTTLTKKNLEPIHLPPRLIGSAAAFMGMVEPMPERYWTQRPDPSEWTPLEVVAHMEDYERDVHRPDLELVARENNPFIPARWNPIQPTTRDLTGVDGHTAALNFAAERLKTVQFLEALPANAWNRPARHSIYGPTTLLELASFIYRYDQLRIRQLCQIIGKCE
ncbi:MAG: DinB family protein, partial [Anaerolineae bacterium]|nr:DinB family protein [Anaerolineae bacterium]